MTLETKTDVHTTVEQVEASPEFQAWSAENPHHYLVHVFSTTGGQMELGYYGKETDRITVFKTAPITAMPPEEVFKEGSRALRQLDLGPVRIGLAQALEYAEKYRQQGYPRHQTMRTISILQQGEGPAWNITLVTNTLNMITMRIDATTGQMLNREMHNIMDLAKQ